MKPVDLRIGPALVVPVASAPFTGYVEVTAGVISHLGPEPTGTAVATAAAGRIVIPGLVNTHCHTSQQLGRGLGDDVDLLSWLHDRIWPYELALTESDAELSALVCAIEQIRNGVTLIADPGGRHVDGMARGLAAAGIRALLGRSAMDSGDGRPPGDRESTDEVLAAQDELVGRWHGRDRMRFSYTLRTILSNLKILGTPRIADMLDAGVLVGLGTDGAPSNNRMSIIDEMWLAAIVQKGLRRDPTVLPAEAVLRMATADGARALGLADVAGTLEVGTAADLVVIDPLTANFATAADPVSALVTALKTENVESVLCDGEWLLLERRITRVDEAAVLAEAAGRAAAVRRRAGLAIS
ncbi:MAG TPA: amidohydrolase family protein [Pseudonocardia sp.]|nr:amidohydrolase family protein [Pseudonocardia sp.]